MATKSRLWRRISLLLLAWGLRQQRAWAWQAMSLLFEYVLDMPSV